MTKTEFILICNEYLIEPSLALENENILQALRDRKSIETIKTILETNFKPYLTLWVYYPT